ncbi:hypothetical protein [Actinacidiphila sp. ITFR-21]|uniref:hypothetical protein n=1 Tax=Actinacidiphila sp. ITFR-21 TaxID=3075199 RepID=UPI002889ABC0|nr:hypothetical protein [Streptomyces sp. ITFR-21]WNI15487.1 hypothetical protein RLT57_08065 [Streptomyces sp. ITFR-21]
MRRSGKSLVIAAVVAALGWTGVLPAAAAGHGGPAGPTAHGRHTGPAGHGRPAAGSGGLTVTALSFERRTVDARSGSATATLRWTMRSSNAAASGFGGEVHLRRLSTATGGYLGTELAASYSTDGSLDGSVAALPGGTPAATTYTWTVAVPQYGATRHTTWAVSELTGSDGAGGSADLTAPRLSAFPRTFTAVTTPDSGYPSLDAVALSGTGASVYADQQGAALRYTLDSQEGYSGVHSGRITVRGPSGQTATGGFSIGWDWSEGYQGCGYIDWLQHQLLSCRVTVPLPAGAEEGDWTVTEVDLTSNAGTTHAYTGLSEVPVHVTSNAVLSADSIAFAPGQVDSWQRTIQTSALTLRAYGARDGVSSVRITDWSPNSGCLQLSTTPTVAADGSLSVPVRALPGLFSCGVSGLVVTDGQGDQAVYGDAYGAPPVSATLTNTPDTVPPTLDGAATLTPATVAADDHATQIALTLDVAASTAGVNGYDLVLKDAAGTLVPISSGGLPLTFSGPLTVYFTLPWDFTPGTYTVGVLLQDQARRTAAYDYPYGTATQPLPGGPVTLTVTP